MCSFQFTLMCRFSASHQSHCHCINFGVAECSPMSHDYAILVFHPLNSWSYCIFPKLFLNSFCNQVSQGKILKFISEQTFHRHVRTSIYLIKICLLFIKTQSFFLRFLWVWWLLLLKCFTLCLNLWDSFMHD